MIRPVAASALFALAALVAAPASASPTDDVRAAMLKFASASSYEMTFISSQGTGTMDYVRPGAMHMSMRGMEMIHVGDATYMKMGGAWRKFPSRSGRDFQNPGDQARALAKEADNITAADLGMRTVDGEMLHAYRVTDTDHRKSMVYVGRDGYPHRLEGAAGTDAIRIGKYNQIAPIRAPI